MLYLEASHFIASGYDMCWISVRKVIALPPIPHPKQWYEFSAGVTMKEGVFSL